MPILFKSLRNRSHQSLDEAKLSPQGKLNASEACKPKVKKPINFPPHFSLNQVNFHGRFIKESELKRECIDFSANPNFLELTSSASCSETVKHSEEILNLQKKALPGSPCQPKKRLAQASHIHSQQLNPEQLLSPKKSKSKLKVSKSRGLKFKRTLKEAFSKPKIPQAYRDLHRKSFEVFYKGRDCKAETFKATYIQDHVNPNFSETKTTLPAIHDEVAEHFENMHLLSIQLKNNEITFKDDEMRQQIQIFDQEISLMSSLYFSERSQ